MKKSQNTITNRPKVNKTQINFKNGAIKRNRSKRTEKTKPASRIQTMHKFMRAMTILKNIRNFTAFRGERNCGRDISNNQ